MAKEFVDQRSVHFSANVKPNPKEHCNFITTRSGKISGVDVGEQVEEEVLKEDEELSEKEKKNEVEGRKNKSENEKNESVNSERKK